MSSASQTSAAATNLSDGGGRRWGVRGEGGGGGPG